MGRIAGGECVCALIDHGTFHFMVDYPSVLLQDVEVAVHFIKPGARCDFL